MSNFSAVSDILGKTDFCSCTARPAVIISRTWSVLTILSSRKSFTFPNRDSMARSSLFSSWGRICSRPWNFMRLIHSFALSSKRDSRRRSFVQMNVILVVPRSWAFVRLEGFINVLSTKFSQGLTFLNKGERVLLVGKFCINQDQGFC